MIDPTAKIATIIYGYVVMGVNSYTIDLVFTGQMQSVQFLIFSQKYEDVRIPLLVICDAVLPWWIVRDGTPERLVRC